MNIAKFYHQATKVKYKGEEPKINEDSFPRETAIYFKEYSRLPKILLPKPIRINFPLDKSLVERKSQREFSGKSLGLKDLSQILFYSAGIIEKRENDWNKTRRAYPSGGALFALEVYPIILNGDNNGVYHYNVKEHTLELLLKEECLRKKIYDRIKQDIILTASAILVISAVFERTMRKYGERGYRYVLLEAGHLGQNIYVVSTALGLKCCAVGGFDDDEFHKLLDIDGEEEAALYVFAIGK